MRILAAIGTCHPSPTCFLGEEKCSTACCSCILWIRICTIPRSPVAWHGKLRVGRTPLFIAFTVNRWEYHNYVTCSERSGEMQAWERGRSVQCMKKLEGA